MAKRAIQLTWVDPNEPTEGPSYRTRPGVKYGDPRVETETSVDVSEIIKTTATSVGTVIFGYVILDAIRQVVLSQFGGKK